MKRQRFPDINILAAHMMHFQESLNVYVSHYEPALLKLFGREMPKYCSYLCPLCLQSLLIVSEKGVAANSEFNLDHYPPKSVGGKNTVLTCIKCNNFSGTNFEAALKDDLLTRSYAARKSKADLKVEAVIKNVEGGPYKLVLNIESDGTHVANFGDLKKVPRVAEWLNFIATKNSNWEATLTVSYPNENKIAKSLLKAAYLFCFCLWGYEFAFSDNANLIRKCIAGDLEYPFKKGYGYWIDTNVENLPQGVCFIEKPDRLINYVVHVPMILKKTDYKCIASVIIPKPTINGWDELKSLANEPTKTYSNVSVREIRHFNISQELFGYTNNWNKIVANNY